MTNKTPAEIFEALTGCKLARTIRVGKSVYQLSAQGGQFNEARCNMHNEDTGHGWGGIMSAAEIAELEAKGVVQ